MKKNLMNKLNKELNVIKAIEYDMVDYETYEFWEPVYINGIENPELADKLLRRAQGRIFSIMKSIGLPLSNWNMFDAFCYNLSSKGIAGAYRIALANK